MEPVTDPVSAADRYRRFALSEAVDDGSPQLARLALAVADHADVLALLGPLERRQQQPNLLFAVLRYHDVDLAEPDAALAWTLDHADVVRHDLATRRTQTNEAARCALLLPYVARAAAGRPVALLELGASAGLCLLPDRYAYAYETPSGPVRFGDGPLLDCVADGVPLPDQVPEIVWRAGVDLNPLDPSDPDTRRWLKALVWPEHTDRAARLDAALDVAAADPPRVLRGDFVTGLEELLSEVPAHASLVVTHTAALLYAELPVREQVLATIRDAGGTRVGAEGFQALPRLRGLDPVVQSGGAFVVSVDDDAVATANAHGRWLRALRPADSAGARPRHHGGR